MVWCTCARTTPVSVHLRLHTEVVVYGPCLVTDAICPPPPPPFSVQGSYHCPSRMQDYSGGDNGIWVVYFFHTPCYFISNCLPGDIKQNLMYKTLEDVVYFYCPFFPPFSFFKTKTQPPTKKQNKKTRVLHTVLLSLTLC